MKTILARYLLISAMVLTISSGVYAELKMKEETFTNSIGMKFVYIRPGTFMMGSPADEKDRHGDEIRHQVTLTKGYYMGVTEVTQGQWKEIMGNNPSFNKNCGDNCPVENVSWNDADEFIKRLNIKEGINKYRLPTEAEWEYACRAGSTARFSFGDNDSDLGDYAWYDSNSGNTTHPVAMKKANAWGLYDMHGNVWEWVSDLYGNCPSGAVTDPEGPYDSDSSERVNRGGSWGDSPRMVRSAFRGGCTPNVSLGDMGFRLSRIP